MSYLNKVMLMGNLTRAPELRRTSSETPVCHGGLAINRVFRDAAGEQRNETTFVEVEAWGRQAETITRYLDKGSAVFIEGRLKLDQWVNAQGTQQSKLKIVVESFQFIGRRPADDQVSDAAIANTNDSPGTEDVHS